MTRKKRVKRALAHEQPDATPYHFDFTVPAYQKMAEHFGDEQFIEHIGNHLAIIEPKTPDAWREIKSDFWQDEFGVVWNRTIDKDIGNVEGRVLPDPMLKNYTFPDPYKPGRFDRYEAFIEAHRDQFVLSEIGFSLFERAWTMRGMPELFMDMVERPDFVDELLDAIVEFNLAIIDQAVQYDIDGCRFGDDWGQQRGLLMGPDHWRRFIKPRLARMYARVKEAGKVVMIHCCGDVKEIFPELIEIGVDVFNPFQPEVMDVYEMKALYGSRITFYGGISIQHTLPYGTPEEVQHEARERTARVGKDGGYILAPSHAIPKDVSLENMLALLEVVQNQ